MFEDFVNNLLYTTWFIRSNLFCHIFTILHFYVTYVWVQYVPVCMCVCVWVCVLCVCEWVYVYVYLYIYLYGWMDGFTSVWVCVLCVCVWVCGCVGVWVYGCMVVWVRGCAGVGVGVGVWVCVCMGVGVGVLAPCFLANITLGQMFLPETKLSYSVRRLMMAQKSNVIVTTWTMSLEWKLQL
jgi:hypothetical protein